MKFEAIVQGEQYNFSSVNNDAFFISGKSLEYILYKRKKWRSADDVPDQLVQKLGTVIDEKLQRKMNNNAP